MEYICVESVTEMNDRFLYFAYGSNMLMKRIHASNRAPSATVAGIGYVQGRKLTFDKKGRDQSGKCDIEKTGNLTDRSYGVVYSVATSDRVNLDIVEGLGCSYDAEELEIIGLHDEYYKAMAYIALKKDSGLKPYRWYHDIVIAGALEHGLPSNYIDMIRSFEIMEDPDKQRQFEHELLLRE